MEDMILHSIRIRLQNAPAGFMPVERRIVR